MTFTDKSEFKQFLAVVKADLYRYQGAKGTKGFIRVYRRKSGFRYTFWMRTAAYFQGRRRHSVLRWVSSWFRHRLGVKYGISIPTETRIGPGLYMPHFGGIVVNEEAVIGQNCNLSHGVTIGQKNRGKFKGCPHIGDRVYIGPGAVIIGSVSVGSDVAIGANAVVANHVNDHEVVIGAPAYSISTKGAKDYVNWILGDE